MSSIDLYRVTMEARVWTMTSAEKAQTYDAGEGLESYEPVAISRGGTEQKNSLAKADLDVDIALSHPLAELLLTSLYDQVVSLTLFNRNGASVSVVWKGRLASIKPDEQSLTLSFESIFTSMRRPGLRARYQKSCRHALYHRGCNLDPEDFATNATLAAINGTALTVTGASSQPDGYFQGGMIRAADGALGFITSHASDQIVVQRMPPSLRDQFIASGPGSAVKLYPGCDHSRQTCIAKFDNLLNYGGFDWIPQKNPMGGSSIV